MGIRNYFKNKAKEIGNSISNKIASAATLSSDQLEEVKKGRENFLKSMPDPNDRLALEITQKLIAMNAIEIYSAYIPNISKIYSPLNREEEYDKSFDTEANIRYFEITKWVTDKKENAIEKLVTVYSVLSEENCNIALILNRKTDITKVYIAISNLNNDTNNSMVNNLKDRVSSAVKGNFPGAKLSEEAERGIVPCLKNINGHSVACATNISSEKSEKFISQTIEKLLDGVVPKSPKEEYTIVLLATPILDVENRKLRLGEIYSGLAPYAQWSTNHMVREDESFGAIANAGINLGTSIGNYMGSSEAKSNSNAKTEGDAKTDTHTDGKTKSNHVGGSVNFGVVSVGGGHTRSDSSSDSVAKTVSNAVTKTLGKTISTVSGMNFGANFGINFAKAANVTATVGVSNGINQNFTNYNIKHALDLLEKQMQRYEQCTALGMWDFAAYVLSEDRNIAANVAHEYLALTQGNDSYMSSSAVNLWRGDEGKEKNQHALEICGYLQELRHPVFGLDLVAVKKEENYYVYPPIVTATASLSGKELAYSLNFPQKSIAGLPVMQCAEFGRNINKYEADKKSSDQGEIEIGKIYHMDNEENCKVKLDKQSLASHVFITGSTGSGKSNTVYNLIEECQKDEIKFLVIEPAKGEYKDAFGKEANVFGTNPKKSKLLKINPFFFPDDIHVLEHVDRLIELFNVCWPMYAAMPAVLKDAVLRAYENAGWDLTSSEYESQIKIYPGFKDVLYELNAVINESAYSEELKANYIGSLATRLNSLTTGLNGQIFVFDEIDNRTLFDDNTIVDLSRIASVETKALIMGVLIMRLQEHRMCKGGGNKDLEHITILEEAHNLLKRTSTEQVTESSNILGKSVEMISQAIAEMRTYGEGFVIVDQSPNMLDMSAIRNTNTKIIHRLPDISDRELCGRASNMNDDQIVELAKLPTGVAAIYQNNWIEPVLCKIKHLPCIGEKYKSEPEELKGNNTVLKQDLLRILLSFENDEVVNYNIDDLVDRVSKSDLSTETKKKIVQALREENKNILNVCKAVSSLFEKWSIPEAGEKANNIDEWNGILLQNLDFDFGTLEEEYRILTLQCLLQQYSLDNQVFKPYYDKWYGEMKGIIL